MGQQFKETSSPAEIRLYYSLAVISAHGSTLCYMQHAWGWTQCQHRAWLRAGM